MKTGDKIVDEVLEGYIERSTTGQTKYGTTLAENTEDNYLLHLQQELMDATLYIQARRQHKQADMKLVKDAIKQYVPGKYIVELYQALNRIENG